jgi:hypothetical protein
MTADKLFTIRDLRSCMIFVVAAVAVFWIGVAIGVVIGRMLG